MDHNPRGGIMMDDKDELKCIKCGKWATPNTFSIEGFDVRGWKCNNCDESYLHPGDAQRVLSYNKLKKETIKAKLSYSGNSLIVRIPSKIVNALDLKKGEEIMLSLEGPNKISIVLAVT